MRFNFRRERPSPHSPNPNTRGLCHRPAECSDSSGSASRTSVAWDRLDASMLSVNEGVTPEPSRLEPFLPTVRLRPSPENPIYQRSNALHHPHTSPQVFSPPRMRRLPQQQQQTSTYSVAGLTSPASFCRSTTGGRSMGDAASASAVLKEELAAQLAHMAGQLRRNAEHFSRRAGGGPEEVRRVAEEKVGANHEVMKRERVWLCDRCWKALRTTCLAISNVVIAIAVLVMLFVIRFT
ncbi:hypothetical protein EDB89DRAFT_2068024 [Lactarius sanguifluus]|nr:hypothetical protein EDB89DRAFT_2068024 [Lactarius sanguifluus]